MEENINIYADLPNFNLTESDINDQPKTDHACNCDELKNKFSSLTNEFENIKKVNKNLETNLASLLKTAKAEIIRKDKMIEELRNQLDNAAFRRNKNGSLGFSTLRSSHHHNTRAEKYESVIPIMNSEEDVFMSQQIEPSYTEYKSRKPQSNIDQVPVTVFGERLYKRIMDDKREEKKLRASSKLSSETNVDKISEECIVESDKENGSQSNINNNANELNAATRSSNSDISYKKNSGKRLNEEDDICKSKRLKTEDNEDRNYDNIDCNSMAQYDTKDNLTELEDKLCVMYSIKKKQVPLETKCRASSEYKDTKQAQNCKNEWKEEKTISSMKDYDDARTRKGSVDNSRSRTASISNEKLNSDHHDHYINDYRKNDYRRDSSRSRSFSKSRSESSSSHRSWEKSSRAYKDRKYDYKYDSRYKNDRSRRGYNKETNSVRTRYSSRERSDLRDKLRHTTSDVEERRNRNSSYKSNKSNKYDNHRLKEAAANIPEDKRSHKSGKAVIEIDFRVSSSRTIVNAAVDYSVEQHSAKNEPCAPANSAESASTCAMKDKNHLEEGEILDSPEKKNDSAKTSTIQTVEENVAKVPIQVKDISGNTPVSIQENAENSPHCTKNDLMQSNPASERTSTYGACFYNFMTNDLHSDKIVMYPSLPSPQIIGSCNNNCDDDYECENCVDDDVRDDIINRHVEELYNFHDENIRSEEMDNANVEGTIEVDKVATILDLASSLPSNDIRQTDHEEIINFTSDKLTQDKIVPNCDNVSESRVSNGNETSHQISDNSSVKTSRTCLDDHNYVRDTIIDTLNLDTTPGILERRELVLETETERTVNIQSTDIKKTSTTVKNKKDQNNKAVVISRRRKAVTLSDNNASMTILINTDLAGSSLVVDNSASDKNDTVSKPRACKLARTIKPSCK